MGIHLGFGSSKFAFTVLQLEYNIVKVIYAKEWDKPSYEAMINLVSKLKVQYRPGKIYVDGNLSEENNYLGIIDQSTGNVYIGWESGTKTFNGTIDEVRIWNRTLSEIEIQAEMTKG